jgi:hypothetical protein
MTYLYFCSAFYHYLKLLLRYGCVANHVDKYKYCKNAGLLYRLSSLSIPGAVIPAIVNAEASCCAVISRRVGDPPSEVVFGSSKMLYGF